ncbi:MAG TPA: hypothetical protein VEY71_08995 [Chitinophagales bacterium]|nr:hypothetical protein [Chitinophagales bacterium]
MRSWIAFLTVSLTFSCARNEKPTVNDTPATFDQSDYSVKEYVSRGEPSLIHRLYDEAVGDNAELKKLEDDLKDYRGSFHDTLQLFKRYDGHSSGYYFAATSVNNAIRDSTLKQRISDLIKRSQASYNAASSSVAGLVKTLDSLDKTIDDYHRALVVVTTLPMIEKYQRNESPGTGPFNTMATRQRELLEREKNLVR